MPLMTKRVGAWEITKERGLRFVWYYFMNCHAHPVEVTNDLVTKTWECSLCTDNEGKRSSDCTHIVAAKSV